MRKLCALALTMPLASVAAADLIPVGPFTGDLSDPLNYPGTAIVASFDIFGGAARLHSHDDHTTYIHYIRSSTLFGDPVTPRSGDRILGFTQGPGIFRFDDPVQRFGAYWNTNSGEDDAMVEFFDDDGELIGSQVASVPVEGNVWTWNGWESDTPISSIRVTGFGVSDGFLWFDDLEMSVVPAPGAVAVLLAPALLGARYQRRRRTDRR